MRARRCQRRLREAHVFAIVTPATTPSKLMPAETGAEGRDPPCERTAKAPAQERPELSTLSLSGALNIFLALKEAGVKDAKMYFGSWNEWPRDPALPIEEGHPAAAQS